MGGWSTKVPGQPADKRDMGSIVGKIRDGAAAVVIATGPVWMAVVAAAAVSAAAHGRWEAAAEMVAVFAVPVTVTGVESWAAGVERVRKVAISDIRKTIKGLSPVAYSTPV